MTNGWKKIKSKIIHQNPWFNYREDDVVLPNGKKGKYYYIADHDAIGIIAEDGDEIYIVGQNRYATGNNYSWEMIAGGKEKDESPLNAAKRELREEADLEAKKWTRIGIISTSNFNSSEKVWLFIASNLRKIKGAQDESENITVKKVKISKFIKMIEKNEVVCGFSIACFYKYLLYKKRSCL